MELLDKIKDELLKISEPEELEEDFNPYEYSGGNFDDAYSLGEDRGYESGKYNLAQTILKIIEEKETE